MERDDPAYKGQREYTPFFPRIYDPLILGFFTPVVWRCPRPRLVEAYRHHIRPRHLDVGSGTGYFVERAGLPAGSPVTLLDPNVHVLAYASRRLYRLAITAVEADVFCKPLPIAGPFDSAALSGVIHCLPGPLTRKAGAIANVAAVLAPNGVLFGASILGPSGRHTRLARGILDANNRQGAFDNLGDTQEGLLEILEASFERVELEIVGSMAIFAAMESAHELVDRHDTMTTPHSHAPLHAHASARRAQDFPPSMSRVRIPAGSSARAGSQEARGLAADLLGREERERRSYAMIGFADG